MAINFGVGQCVDIFMRAGEMSCSMPLENDRWVLATIALAKEDRILVHVSGGSARWLPRQSAELAMPGVYTGGGGLGRAASHARVFSTANSNLFESPKCLAIAINSAYHVDFASCTRKDRWWTLLSIYRQTTLLLA